MAKIPQLPNQPLASKPFVVSHAYSFFLQKLNGADGLSLQLCMQKV
jgi:hypothetical protein